MESDQDLEIKHPGWITPTRTRLLYELVLYDKYNRWFPLWFVRLYLIVGYIKSDFWGFVQSFVYRLSLLIFPLILLSALFLIILLTLKQ